MLIEQRTDYFNVMNIKTIHIYKKYVYIKNSSNEYGNIKRSIPENAFNVKFESYSSGLLIMEYDLSWENNKFIK